MMKIKKTIFGCFLLFIVYNLNAQNRFYSFFTEQALRIDFGISVNADTMKLFNPGFRLDPYWGGNIHNLIDTINGGVLSVRVFDSISGEQIFSKCFSSLAYEYQQTDMAVKFDRYFQESVQIPFPLRTVRICMFIRNKDLQFVPVDTFYVNPSVTEINKERPPEYETKDILLKGSFPEKVDLVFIPEGYTSGEMKKFIDDVKRFTDTLFSWEPYDEFKEQFNIRAVLAPSEESGIDIPGDNVWKNTLLNASFGTFGSERYITTPEVHKLRNIAACVPYDQIIIMVNTDKYGGGGIYNCYSVFSAHNMNSGFLFLHEFGHGFADLADEYYDDEKISYYGDTIYEPYSINLTTLVHFESKWKSLVKPGTPVPTPPDRSKMDVVGAYEGGSYVSKGIYRCLQSCSMKDIVSNKFCPVCQEGIIRMIKFYSGNKK